MKIPSLPKYNITLYGKVTNISTGEVIREKRNRNGLRSVLLYKNGHKTTVSLARLVLQTFRPLKEGLSDDWMSVLYMDGDRDNIHASNLQWSVDIYYPRVCPGITHPSDAWFPVSWYDDFEVKLEPEILFRNSRTGSSWKPAVGDAGYLQVLTPDGKFLDVHRLLALMFLVHPVDVWHLTVNHKDSNKLNNKLDNLEWATQSENNQYAVDEGNRAYVPTNAKRLVKLYNVETGVVVDHPSVNAVARFLDTNPGHVHSLCTHRQRRGLGYKGFLIKFADDPTPWDEIKNDVQKNQEVYNIAVKDMFSGKVTVYDSLMKTVTGEHINPKTIYRLLGSDVLIPWNGKCFQTYKESMTWPNYPHDIVRVYLRVRNGGRPFKVTYRDGRTEYAAGATEWCNNHPEAKVAVEVLNRSINRDGEWNGIKFEYIDLKQYR